MCANLSGSEVESDEEKQNKQDGDNAKEPNASEEQTDDDKDTSDDSEEDSEDSADTSSHKPVTVEDMIGQLNETEPSSDVKTPDKMVRNIK
jgi:cytoskeletal protein RodZ